MKAEKILLGNLVFWLVVAVTLRACFGENGVHILPTPTDGPCPAVTLPGTATAITGPVVTRTASPTPIQVQTITPIPSPTREIALSGTPGTPAIVEITAFPYPTREGSKAVDVIGVYVPRIDMNLRSCAAAIPACYTGEGLKAGERYQFYAMVTVYPSGDIWLCLDSLPDGFGGLTSQCKTLVAYYLQGVKYGSLEIVVPAGG